MKLRLAFLEKNPLLCDELVQHFRNKGFDAYSNFTVEEFEEDLGRNSVHILIADSEVLCADQCKFLRKIKQYNSMLYVIMLTDESVLEDFLLALRYGIDDCIFKPMDSFVSLEQSVKLAYTKHHYWQSLLKQFQKRRLQGDTPEMPLAAHHNMMSGSHVLAN